MKKLFYIIIIIAVAVLGIWIYQKPNSQNISQKIYENNDFNFSFNYPSDYKITEMKENNTILIEPNATSTTSQGFQILITPFDEADDVITADRIQSDIPDMAMENVKSVAVGNNTAVSFNSDNEDFNGKSFEIWFAHSGNLYQLSGYAESQSLMEEVIGGWKFKN